MDTMYLAQEKAYRELYQSVVSTIRDGSYARDSAFEAAAQRDFSHVRAAIASWSIWPVYGGLILIYVVASYAGWTEVFAPVPKAS